MHETSEMALSDYERRREAELREVREQLWSAQQEAKAQHDRSEGLRKTLEECKANVSGFKVCVDSEDLVEEEHMDLYAGLALLNGQ